MEYYDWRRTFTYNADVTMVVGARGLGKTYGLRMQFIRDWLKDGSRFVEICRFRNELSDVSNGYFDRVGNDPEWDNKYVFRTDAHNAYIAERPTDDHKPQWKRIGYFVSLTEAQKLKKRTFEHVYRLCMDEAVLERSDRYHRYLPDEVTILANVVDSCSRERAGETMKPPRVYLLGNACDLLNPYFIRYGVNRIPDYGRHWYGNHTFLLDYVKPGEYETRKQTGTVAGRMLDGLKGSEIASGNRFIDVSSAFITKRPKWARFAFGIRFMHEDYGVYQDNAGVFYVEPGIPEDTRGRRVWSLTREDDSLDYDVALKSNEWLRRFALRYTQGYVRFASYRVKDGFMRVLETLGVG